MKKLCIHLLNEDHAKIKAKAALANLSLLEVGRRLFLAWERGEVYIPDDKKASGYYPANDPIFDPGDE